MNSLSPADVRQLIRQRRRQIGYGAQQRAARRLAKNVLSTTAYQQSQHIAVYWAVDGEIDLRFFIKAAWSQGKSCYLPVLERGGTAANILQFAHYQPGQPLVSNRFGIAEPQASRRILAQALDLVLLPLVAFDHDNHRIGMGGGFYDRTFAERHQGSTYLMGVAHGCQYLPLIEPMPWDVKLDEVVTD